MNVDDPSSRNRTRFHELKEAIMALPSNTTDVAKNIRVQTAARSCLSIPWNNLTDEEIEEFKLIVITYQTLQSDGVFNKTFTINRMFRSIIGQGESGTREALLSLFRRASSYTIKKSDGSTVQVKITDKDVKVIIKGPSLLTQASTTFTEAANAAHEMATSILPTFTRPGMSTPLRLRAKYGYGSMSNYYDQKVGNLKLKAQALQSSIQRYQPTSSQAPISDLDAEHQEDVQSEDSNDERASSIHNPQHLDIQVGDPRQLASLMQQTIDIAKELQDLKERAGWENDSERGNNPTDLLAIHDAVTEASTVCLAQITDVIRDNPGSYISACSADVIERTCFLTRMKNLYALNLHPLVKKTYPSSSGPKTREESVLHHEARSTYLNFQRELSSISDNVRTIKQLKSDHAIELANPTNHPIVPYIEHITEATQSFLENSPMRITNMKNNIREAAKIRLRLVGLEEEILDSSPTMTKLDRKIDALRIEIYEEDDKATSDCVNETLHAFISDFIYETVLDQSNQTQQEYRALRDVLNAVDTNFTRDRPQYTLSSKQLTKAINIAKEIRQISLCLFQNPYAETSTTKTETYLTQIDKLQDSQKKLRKLKRSLTKTPKTTETDTILEEKITALEQLITQEIARLSNPQTATNDTPQVCSQEALRRKKMIIRRFCNFAEKQLQANEMTQFQEQMVSRVDLQVAPPEDPLTLRIPITNWEKRESQVWLKWLQTKKIPGMDLTRLTPTAAIGALAINASTLFPSVAKEQLTNEFNLYFQEQTTYQGIINQKIQENPLITDEELYAALAENLPNYDEAKAIKVILLFRQIKEQTRAKIAEAQILLKEQLLTAEGVSKELENWQILQALEATGFSLNTQQLQSILEINISNSDLQAKAIDVRSGSTFYYLRAKLKALKSEPSSQQQYANHLGGLVLKYTKDYQKINRTNRREARELIRKIIQLKKDIADGTEETLTSKPALEKQCNALILHSFLHINKLRMEFNDADWASFSTDIGLRELKQSTRVDTYTLVEVYEICSTSSDSLNDYKIQYENLLSKLAQGEEILQNEIDRVTQNYARALQIFRKEISLIESNFDSIQRLNAYDASTIPERLYPSLSLSQRQKFYTLTSSENVSIETIARSDNRRYSEGDIYLHLTAKTKRLITETREIKTKTDTLENPELQLRDTASLLQKKGIIFRARILYDQIQADTFQLLEVPRKVQILQEYIYLLENSVPQALQNLRAISPDTQYPYIEALNTQLESFPQSVPRERLDEFSSLNNILAANRTHIPDWNTERLAENLRMAKEELSRVDSRAHLPPIMKQNIAQGIKQRAWDFATKDLAVTFPVEETVEENQIVLNYLNPRYLELVGPTRDLMQSAYDSNEPYAILAYTEWAEIELEQLNPQPPVDLPDLETTSVKEILTFLSRVSGQDPEIYNPILLDRCTSYMLSKSTLPISRESQDKIQTLALEVDSIFFGAKWREFVHRRCWLRSSMTGSDTQLRRDAKVDEWKNGGIACFSALQTFRQAAGEEQREGLRIRFIKEVIIPSFQAHGITLRGDLETNPATHEANLLMNAMIKLQSALPTATVSCTDFDDKPELKSLFFGKKWSDFVHSKCTAAIGIQKRGTHADEWAPGGIQHLENLTESLGVRVRTAFIDEQVIPCLRMAEIQNPTRETAEQWIQKAIDFQKYGALTSIKRKTIAYSQNRDPRQTTQIERAMTQYFQSIGVSEFTQQMSVPFLIEMRNRYKQRQQTSLSADKLTAYQNLVRADKTIDRNNAEILGFSEPQITALESCQISDQDALSALGTEPNVVDFNKAAITICERRLAALDRDLRPPQAVV